VDGEHGPPLPRASILALARGFHAISDARWTRNRPRCWLDARGNVSRLPTATLTVLGDTMPRRDPPTLLDRGLRRHRRVGGIGHRGDRTRGATPMAGAVVFAGAASSRPGRADRGVRRHYPPRRPTIPYIVELSDLELFFCCESHWRLLSNRPILVVGDLEQVRDKLPTSDRSWTGLGRDRDAAHRCGRGDQPARRGPRRPRTNNDHRILTERD